MAFRAAEYDRFTGPRRKAPVWWPLFTATIRRGWGSKWVRRITFASMMMALTVTTLFYFLYQVIPDWQALMKQFGQATNPGGKAFVIDSHAYLGLLRMFVYPVLLPLSLVFGYDLVAADLRSNAFESYFSRSITPLTYLVGRTLAFVSFLMLVTYAPVLWIWTFDVSIGPDGHFAEVAAVPLGMGAALLVTSIMLALMMQAITAVTRSGIWTNLVFVVVFLFSAMLGGILFGLTNNPNWFAVNPLHCIHVFCSLCMGTTERLNRRGMEPTADPEVVAAVITGTIVICLVILWRSLRRRGVVG